MATDIRHQPENATGTNSAFQYPNRSIAHASPANPVPLETWGLALRVYGLAPPAIHAALNQAIFCLVAVQQLSPSC